MHSSLINKVTTPALPVTPRGTQLSVYLDDLNNILRLFFNCLSNTVNLLTGDYGGRFISTPNAKFFSTVDQNAASPNTAYALQFENTYLGEAISIVGSPKTQITPTHSGVYNFALSVELNSTSASTKTVNFWVRRSGVDIANTAREHVIAGSGSINVFSYTFSIYVQAGQYIELMWASDDTNITLDHQAAASPAPVVPSTLVTVNLISALPETLPTP